MFETQYAPAIVARVNDAKSWGSRKSTALISAKRSIVTTKARTGVVKTATIMVKAVKGIA